MKKLFFAVVAALMLTGTVVAAENVVVNNNMVVADAPNAFDKAIALVKAYTKKVKAVKSIEELEALVANLEKDTAAVGKEVEAFVATLGENELENYYNAFYAASEELMKAVEEKIVELAGEDDNYSY